MALVCNKGIYKGFDSKEVMMCNDLNRKVLRGFLGRLENDVSKVLFKNPIFSQSSRESCFHDIVSGLLTREF